MLERPKPSESKYFELLIRDYLMWKYPQYPLLTLYGKSGDPQHGCDVMDQNRRLIVQCKCYDNYDPNAHKRLVREIRNDYTSAVKYFKTMEIFVVCTTLSVKASTQDQIYGLIDDIPINIFFWEDIQDFPGGYLRMKQRYIKDYLSPLFLHENRPQVCLKNLFVDQKYRVLWPITESQGIQNERETVIRSSQGGTSHSKEKSDNSNIWGKIGAFVENSKESFLIIEGDAGCGKTSLIQSLCWHEQEIDECAKIVLHDRPLVIIRFRDLRKELINYNKSLLPAILDLLDLPIFRMGEDRKEVLIRRFPNAIMVLDGFDELCIIEGIENYEQLLYQLYRERLSNWKFIVTSRPNYIRKNIDIPHEVIALEHFDYESRQTWLNRFTSRSYCGQFVNDEIKQYILNGEEGICDTPLSLYLLAGGNMLPGTTNNLWFMYNQLFSTEITERLYDVDHPGAIYKDKAYLLPSEVADWMYQNGNAGTNLRLTEDELGIIAARLMEDLPENTRRVDASRIQQRNRDLADRCIALCCYWKLSEDRGMIEFYHNNIRDFFLCEHIYNKLNIIYKSNSEKEEIVRLLVQYFRNYFRSGQLPQKTCEFLYLRSSYAHDNHKNDEFPMLEYKEPLLPELFQRLLTDGTIYDGMNEKKILVAISSILRCVAQIYRAVLEPFRGKGEFIRWWKDISSVNECQLLRRFSGDIFRYTDKTAPLWGSPGTYSLLRNVDFHCADLQSTDFRGADLRDAHLQFSCCQNAKFQDAILCYEELHSTFFQGADIEKEIIENMASKREVSLLENTCSKA